MTYVPAENKRNIPGGDGTICEGAKPLVYTRGSSGENKKINNKLSYQSE